MFDFFRARPKKRKVKIKKSGVIFSNPSKIKTLVFGLGTLVFVFSFFYVIYLYYPLGKALIFYENQKKMRRTTSTKVPELIYPNEKYREINYDDFQLVIPNIFAVSKIKANVSASNKDEYLPILSENIVAHAKGSALPGEGKGKTVYLFAHSTFQDYSLVRKNAVFYLLNKLETGNQISIVFSGKEYLYEVYDSKVVESDEVSLLEYRQDEFESLLLQTCWPLGTNWKRLVVFAKLVAII